MTDKRSKNALVVAQNHALGLATDDELRAAWDAAWAAAWAEGDAAWAAGDVAWHATRAAAWAAKNAAWDAASASQKEMFIKMCKGEAPWQI